MDDTEQTEGTFLDDANRLAADVVMPPWSTTGATANYRLYLTVATASMSTHQFCGTD